MATKLLCIGDVAISGEMPGASPWPCPEGLEPGPEHQILFNWEFPFGQKNDKPRQRGQRFVACADALQVIRDWAPGIATLATNHALDAGSEGLFETIEKFHQKAFLTVGAGTAPEEMNAPVFWETSEGTVAILNWVFAETHPDWMAIPGPNCWPGIKEAGRQIAVARSRSDWVLVIVHWSDELFAHPLPGDRTTAFALADAGADMIIGHHPHVVRGMEQFGNCPVFYSLGNFYFSEIRDVSGKWVSQEAPRTREGLGVTFIFRRGQRPNYQLHSFWNTKHEVVPDRFGRALRRMEAGSRALRRHALNGYADWYAAERARFNRWGMRWHFGLRRRGVLATLHRLCQKRVSVANRSDFPSPSR